MNKLELKGFHRLVDAIRKFGYGVDVYMYDTYISASVENRGAIVRFNTSSGEVFEELSGKVVIDNYKYSDVWNNCAVFLPIPRNDYQINFILEQIKFWESSRGARIRKNRILNKYIYRYPPHIYGLR